MGVYVIGSGGGKVDFPSSSGVINGRTYLYSIPNNSADYVATGTISTGSTIKYIPDFIIPHIDSGRTEKFYIAKYDNIIGFLLTNKI